MHTYIHTLENWSNPYIHTHIGELEQCIHTMHTIWIKITFLRSKLSTIISCSHSIDLLDVVSVGRQDTIHGDLLDLSQLQGCMEDQARVGMWRRA